MPDTQIHPTGTVAAPGAWRIPDSAELQLKVVYATFDGSGASGPFLPTVRIISDAGSVVFETAADTTVAAGASADASWFPHIASKPAAAGGGIQFDVDNVGGSLEVETTGYVPTDFSQPYAARHGATDYGEAFNAANGVLFTVPPDSFANSGNAAVTIEDYKGSGDFGAFGQLIQVQDGTAGGTSNVIGQQIIAGADGIENAVGTTAEALMGPAGTADSIAGSFGAVNQGSGREIGVEGAAGYFQSGANALCFLGQDGAGNSVFEVYSDGNIHIKAGATVTADL